MKKFFKDNLNILVLITGGLLALTLLGSGSYYSHGYYIFLRIIVTTCFTWIAYRKFIANSGSKLLIIYGLIIILFNPFILIELEESTWLNIDLFTGFILFVYMIKTIIDLKKSQNPTPNLEQSTTINDPKKVLSIVILSFILLSAIGNSSKIYSLESRIDDKIEDIPDMSGSISDMESQISDIESDVSSVTSRVDDLEGRLSY